MADNVELNAGTGGATCATDDCGAAGHTQRVKLSIATDGSATAIPADAKGLQVQQPTAADLNVTVVGTVTADAGTNLNTSALAVEAGGNLAHIAAAVASDHHVQVDVLSAPSTAVTNADMTTVAGAVSGGHMQVDVLSAPSTAVTNADITTIAGAVAGGHMQVDVLQSFALETGGNLASAVTALQVIDNCISGSEAQVDVVAALPAGTNLIGDVMLQPRAASGGTAHSRLSTGDANDFVSVADGAACLLGGWITNTNAAVRYVKFYNKATAPDPSADTPALRFAIPGATTGGGGVFNIPCGVAFGTGLGYAVVTGVADTDETAVAANELIVNLWYKH